MTPFLKLTSVGLCSLALAVAACNKQAKTSSTSAGAPSPDTVVATYGSKKVTLQELDEQLGDEMQELEKRKNDLRRQGIEQLVLKDLVKAEADKKGLTEEQYLKAEIDEKVGKPSEQEIEEFFKQNQAQLPPGATLADFKDRIADYLSGPKKQQRAQELFTELKKNANVKVTLPEPPQVRKQVEAKGPSRGPENAKVTIVEFSDFQCPYCSRAKNTVDQVMEAYAGKVRLVFRHMPLDFHKEAPKAAEASLCANEQGKFWEYHDKLFASQSALQIPQLKDHATAIGLDGAKFGECLDSGKFANVVKQDMEAAQKAGVRGTPAFFINGVMLSGAQPFEEFKAIIDKELGIGVN